MYMLIFKLQTPPEPTQTSKPAYLNLDSPPYHRCVIVWSPLLFGIFPLSVNGRNISVEQQQRNETNRQAQSRGEQPRSETKRAEQAQQETDKPLDAGARDRPAGLQRGDDSRY
ncbi:hypothetical protein PGT21_021077 [Puccinia graminis f. sp. tritici]|uniref:Uncharacterized protein n=1 Tax=Puccinia graminis f. sp. tritici TaxID=56615 RepID=A0A5B0MLG0_PUCGR|nr:hypothetical protein PGT21_021077 [Puccinia graminis f. sp. tritici]